jgi:hypothetical protein
MKQETTMLKTISAALLAVSFLAAPALAAGATKTTQAPAVKTEQVKTRTAEQAKPKALNANARIGRHHHRHYSHRRSHKQMGALKTHKFSKVSKASIKHVAPATKRG